MHRRPFLPSGKITLFALLGAFLLLGIGDHDAGASTNWVPINVPVIRSTASQLPANIANLNTNLGQFTSIVSNLGGLGPNVSVQLGGLGSISAQLGGLNLGTLSVNLNGLIQSGQLNASQLASVAGLATQVNSLLGMLGSSTSGLNNLGIIASGLNSLSGFNAQISGLLTGQSGLMGQLGSLSGNISSLLSATTGGILNTNNFGAIGNLAQSFGLLNMNIGALTGNINGLNGLMGALTGQINVLSSFINMNPSALIGNIGSLTGMLGGLNLGNITSMMSSITRLTSMLSSFNVSLNNITSLMGSLGGMGGVTNMINGISGVGINTINSAFGSLPGLTNAVNAANTALASVNGAINLSNVQGGNDNQIFDPCPSPKCSGSTTPNKDTRYTNMQIISAMQQISNTQAPSSSTTIDPGLQGVMPAQVMPNKATPVMTLIDNFPWLYKDIDPKVQWVYRGTGNNTSVDVNSIVCLPQDPDNPNNNTNTNTACTPPTADDLFDSDDGNDTANNPASIDVAVLNKYNCKPVNNTCGTPDYDHLERWTRLQYDNCTSQYLLPIGLNAQNSMFYQQYRNHQYPWNETVCQPFRLSHVDCIKEGQQIPGKPAPSSSGGCLQDKGSDDQIMYDYRAWGYLERGWHDVLDSNDQTDPQGGGGSVTNVPQAGNYFSNWGGNPDPTSLTSTGNAPVVICQSQAQSSIKCTGNGSGQMSCTGSVTCSNGGNGNAGQGIVTGKIGGWTQYGTPWDWSKPGNHDNPTGSFQGKLTDINKLASSQYERIWETTHPYTPRWDFSKIDRYYSHLPDLPTILQGPGSYKGYIEPQYDSQCVVRCAAVPVDILTFRFPEFDACMRARIQVNTQCFWTEVTYLTHGEGTTCCPARSPVQAYFDTIADNVGCCRNTAQTICKTHFNQKGQWPVCSTKYDHPNDASENWCGSGNNYGINPEKISGDSNSVKKCCDHLAQALAPINTLKIRNTHEDPELQDPQGNMPEGYTFKEYFSNHMPYMRWWDTATAAGGASGSDRNYDPNCDLGQYDTFVGVGKEGKRCRFGGSAAQSVCVNAGGGAGGGAGGVAGTTDCDQPNNNNNNNTNGGGNICVYVPQVDALTSWEELKQYQSQTLRDYGLDCLAQFEKVHKTLGGEDAVLGAAGTYFPSAGAVPNDNGGAGGAGTQQSVEISSKPWPLGWRGYLTDPDQSTVFPNFGSQNTQNQTNTQSVCNNGQCTSTCQGDNKAHFCGLDNAQVGDIVYLTIQDVQCALCNVQNQSASQKFVPMPFAAIVTGVCRAGAGGAGGSGDTCVGGDYVEVVAAGNGKYPDACGNNDSRGFGQTQRIMKTSLPQNIQNVLAPGGTLNGGTVTNGAGNGLLINSQGNCTDTKYSTCTFNTQGMTGGNNSNLWNQIEVYRPGQDVRGQQQNNGGR